MNLGRAATSASLSRPLQPMKIAGGRGAVEHRAARQLLAVPDRRLHAAGPEAELRDRDPEAAVVPRRPARFSGKVQGLNELQAAVPRRSTGRGTTSPPCARSTGHAGDGLPRHARAPRGRRSARSCTGRRKLETTRWFLWTGVIAIAFLRSSPPPPDGCLTEIGPPAVDRAGAAEDRAGQLPERQHDDDRRSASPCSSLLYGRSVVVDFVLMRRYARLDPPDVERGRGCPGAGDELLGRPRR